MKSSFMTRFLLGLPFLTITSAFAQDVNLNGFASVHATQKIAGKSSPEYFNQNKSPNFYNFTKFGLNISSTLADKWSVASQVLVRGNKQIPGSEEPQWGMYANWAFLAFKPKDNWRIRLGRQLFPAWIISENIDVGYMYPWTEAPHAVYDLAPFKSLNGVSTDYTFNLSGDKKLGIMVFGGEETQSVPLSTGGNETNAYGNIVGAEITLLTDGHKFRLMGAQYNVSSTTSENSKTYEDNRNNTLIAGYRYDKNNWLVYAEGGLREGHNGSTVLQADTADLKKDRIYNKRVMASYITTGYWFGDILPHVTASNSHWDTGTTQGSQDLYSLGLNYKVSPNIIMKSNIGYSISRNGPTHMDQEGDSTTVVTGFDMIF